MPTFQHLWYIFIKKKTQSFNTRATHFKLWVNMGYMTCVHIEGNDLSDLIGWVKVNPKLES